MISLAHAQEAAGAVAQQPSFIEAYLPLIVILIVFWFLMIRPQMKRAKEHKLLLEGLQKGDEIVTQGGLAGRVVKVGEAYVTVEFSQGAEMLVQKSAVTLALPKGTLKEAR